MDIKFSLTSIIGDGLNWTDGVKRQKHGIIWQNPRKKPIGGLRLTDEGFRIFTEDADIKSYNIEMPNGITITNQITIWLDRFIDGPYYLTKKSIVVFKEKTAVQLILFSGDVQKFGIAKAMNQERTEN